jgi:hypothetical protein
MASLDGIDAYMEQWLKTATKGNVRFTMAFLTNRMHLHCDKCNVGMTCEKPADSTTIDYAVQEYVKLHAHVGGYNDKWKCEMCGEWTDEALTGPSGHGTTCKALVVNGGQTVCDHKKADGSSALINHMTPKGDRWVYCVRCGVWAKPMTMDFKDLPAKDMSLGMKSGSQTQVFDVNTGKPVIDEKPQNAAIIQQQMQKYDASQLTDYQLAKKIAELQLGDKKKAQEMVGQMQSEVDELFEQAKFDDAAKLNEALKAKKAQLQQLELQEVQAKILWAKSQIKQVPIVVERVPAKPVSAPLTDVFEDKGRKFR